MDIYYVDGEFVPEDQAKIPVNDLAVLRGIGVFDVLRTYNGKPFLLNAHIKRLENSAKQIGLAFPWTRQELADIVTQTLEHNSHPESSIRIVITGGSSPDFITLQGKPRLLVLVAAAARIPPEWITHGVKVITLINERKLPGAKSINYLSATMALNRAKSQGAVEAVYMDRSEHILEGTTSNIFAFIDDHLVTPEKEILSGITRQVVLKITQDWYTQQTRDLTRNELIHAQEIFITGTGKGLLPVVQVDEHTIGNGRPGPRTQRIMDALVNYTRDQSKGV